LRARRDNRRIDDELLELLTRGRPAWHADAACAEHPDVSFFPARGEDHRPAKAICARCLVRAECLAFGIEEPEGLWGGLGWQERRRLRVERGEVVIGRHRAVA
jgi:WhiB family redox-sensing transcriptional regulator